MAITIKPKQALSFLPARDCVCNSRYCQPIKTTDNLMLQGCVSIATEINLLQNGDFADSSNWTLGSGWTISGGKLNATNISGTNAVSQSKLGLIANKLYLVEIVLTVTSVGSATAGQGWIVSVNGDPMQLPDDIPLGDGYNHSLTATWVYKPSSITSDNVVFETDESTIDFNVSYLNIYELSEVGLAIMNDETVVDLATFTGGNFVKYYFNGELIVSGSYLYEAALDATDCPVMFEMFITWEDVTEETGCLTTRIYDNVFLRNRVRNGTFTSNLNYWTELTSANWSWNAGGSAEYTWNGFTQGDLFQNITLLGGQIYNLSFGVVGQCKVRVSINSGTPILLGTFTSLTSTSEIDLTAYSGLVDVKLIFSENPSNHNDFYIDNVSVISSAPDSVNESGCINIQTEQPCTLYLYAHNLDDAFGFDYTSGSLQHWLRVYGRIKYNGYPEEKMIFSFSDNSQSILFAKVEKEFEVIIGDAPEGIHDCISVLRLHDTFNIELSGTFESFVSSSEYDLKQRRSSDNSQATFQVKEKQGVSSNYNCV